jgi:hypothetical protein
MPYRNWLPQQIPDPFLGPSGLKFWAEMGGVLDDLRAQLVEAARASMPGAGPDDALPYIGSEVQLEQGAGESNAKYAERLRLAFDTWKRGGSHPAILQQLALAGFDVANLFMIQRSGRRSSIDGDGVTTFVDGPLWTWSAKPPEAYAEFGLLFTVPQPDLDWSEVGGFSEGAAKLNRIVRKWKKGNADFHGTRILESGAWWGWPTTRTWGSFVYGGATSFIPPA